MCIIHVSMFKHEHSRRIDLQMPWLFPSHYLSNIDMSLTYRITNIGFAILNFIFPESRISLPPGLPTSLFGSILKRERLSPYTEWKCASCIAFPFCFSFSPLAPKNKSNFQSMTHPSGIWRRQSTLHRTAYLLLLSYSCINPSFVPMRKWTDSII